MGTPANAINVSTVGLVKFDSPDDFTTTTVTQYATLVGGATNAITSVGPGTAGHVLTSNGAGVDPSYQAASASGAVTQLNGDTGSATPAAGVITLDANTNAGKTVKFTGSGSTVSLSITDASGNIIMGALSGSGTISGTNNIGIGVSNFSSLTSGSRNVGPGKEALRDVTTGSDNTALGDTAGQTITTGSRNTAIGSNALSTTETGTDNIAIGYAAGLYAVGNSSNIAIGNSSGGNESNVMRLGVQGSGTGQQNACFIAGITGVTTTVANRQLVTVNSSTTQVGTSAFSTVIQKFTATGTYTPTSGMLYCIVEAVGGGGGGAGLTGGGAATGNSSGGGGSGAYSKSVFSAATIGASKAVSIGAGGTGGAAGNNAGNNGGDTTFGTTLLTAGGGKGAAGGTNNAGGAGGTAGTGDIAVNGNPGGNGSSVANNTTIFTFPYGGNTVFGPGGFLTGALNATQAGVNATGFGGGGSGANAYASASSFAGGNGKDGILIVTEYVIA